MKIKPISSPLPGEYLVSVRPSMRPDGVIPAHHIESWRKRLSYWAGRTLTKEALELEQENRTSRLSRLSRFVTPGIVRGLEAALEPPASPSGPLSMEGYLLHILPGHGLTVYGDDITIPRPLSVPLKEIEIIGGTPGDIPWASVVVIQPFLFSIFANHNPDDPCEFDLSRDAYADERLQDAALLRLVPLEEEWVSRVGDINNPTRRNRIAHLIFEEEAERSANQALGYSLMEGKNVWNTMLRDRDPLPWETEGLPIGILGTEVVEGQLRFFFDRASVVRSGGETRPRSRPAVTIISPPIDATSLPGGVGTPGLWKARVDQFAEHLTELKDGLSAAELADSFQFIPPVGLLPSSALQFLTTDEADANNTDDRAALNYFFPAEYVIDAVPVPLEDLDATLSAGASLAPLDLQSASREHVRYLIPVPLDVFDKNLLVVEQEDPLFEQEIGRLVAERQDWRQRRDDVLDRRDELQRYAAGTSSTSSSTSSEEGQLEPEPKETVASLGFSKALLSPSDIGAPWELDIALASTPNLNGTDTFYLHIRVDEDRPPGSVEVVLKSATGELPNSWQTKPDYPLERTNSDGLAEATPLWLRYTVQINALEVDQLSLEGFTLRFSSGRLAISQAGYLRGNSDNVIWRAGEGAIASSRGQWTVILNDRLLAPFELPYALVFENDQTLEERLKGIDSGLTLDTVEKKGLNEIIESLEAQINRGNDFVDLGFLKLQSNLHRVRQVILGEEVANELLISPALNSFVRAKSARIANEQLLDAYNALPDIPVSTAKSVREGEVESITSKYSIQAKTQAGGTRGVANTSATTERATGVNLLLGGVLASTQKGVITPSTQRSPQPKDVVESEPSVGEVPRVRTVSFAKRFDEGAATNAKNFVSAELTETLKMITEIDLGIDRVAGTEEDAKIPDAVVEINGTVKEVTYGDLANDKTLLGTIRFKTLDELLNGEETEEDDKVRDSDVSATFSLGVRRADTTLAILRRMEFYVARRNKMLNALKEVLALIQEQVVLASRRLVTLNNKLEEARHDVSVARSLYAEEVLRVEAINARRDTVLQDEVQFVAYMRPRTVSMVRNELAYWQPGHSATPAPVPACLRQHDEAPDPIRAYVQLFRNAPARWFMEIKPRLAELNTREKLFELVYSARRSATAFIAQPTVPFVRRDLPVAPLTVLQSSFSLIEAHRRRAAEFNESINEALSWSQRRRNAEEHASLGDVVNGRHGNAALSKLAANELEMIEQIATCLHAEFASIPPVIRLSWIERYSQFDRPAPLDELYRLPNFASLPRETKKSLQIFVDWLFSRVDVKDKEAFSFMNDLVRICILLASYAPVRDIISGRIPRPTPVRPGILVPILPAIPSRVRVGMQFQVWRASTIVARGRVEDLRDNEANVRVDTVESDITSIDESMRVQFIPRAFSVQTAIGRVLR